MQPPSSFLSLLLLLLPLSSSSSSKGAPSSSSWDEVNVLAHGLLQLGRGLREHVERTRVQLRLFNASLARLEPPEGWQNLVSRQNSKIEELSQKVKQQQYRMDKQNLQIKSLQSKVNLLLPLHQKGAGAEEAPRKGGARRGPENQTRGAATKGLGGPEFPAGCHQIFLDGGQSSGVYRIQPPGAPPFEVFCDVTPGGGSWTVIQRRSDGGVNFDRPWEAYRNGFGNLTGDFWLGLEKVRHIVKDGRFRLLIELRDWEDGARRAEFLFRLGGEETAYALSLLGPVGGDLEDAMGGFPQLPFSTRDRDHDLKGDANCAKHLTGGWWFSACGHVNLNGKYFRSIPRQRHERKQGIFWKTWRGRYYPLRATAMKIRPAETGAAS